MPVYPLVVRRKHRLWPSIPSTFSRTCDSVPSASAVCPYGKEAVCQFVPLLF